MKKYLAIFIADIKNIRRDPTLLLLFWVPVMIWAVVRFGLPQISIWLPEMVDYYLPAVLFFALLIAIFPGFIVSFIILDEKDAQLIPTQKVTPVSLNGFLLVRLAFMVVLGFIFSSSFLLLNGLIAFSFIKILVIALFSALNSPILILLMAAFAKNKVEGMTWLKVANVTYIIPLAMLFINSGWKFVLGIFPAFWVVIFAQNPGFLLSAVFALIGLVILLFEIYLSYRLCIKKLHLL